MEHGFFPQTSGLFSVFDLISAFTLLPEGLRFIIRVRQALFFRARIGRADEISGSEGEQHEADKAQCTGEGIRFFNLNEAVGKINEAGL